jgi:hypothetical protein
VSLHVPVGPAEQSISPAAPSVTPPVPRPATVTFIVWAGGGSKVAVTLRAWSMVTWQVVSVPAQSTDQPAKVEGAVAVAVRVTIVP